MKINWKLRLQNKATLVAIFTLCVAFAYQLCGLLGVVPRISQSSVMELIELLIKVLVLLGVIVDPTTEGLNDSTQAMGYDEPKKD